MAAQLVHHADGEHAHKVPIYIFKINNRLSGKLVSQ